MCLQSCWSVAKLHLFHKGINDNPGNKQIESKWTNSPEVLSLQEIRKEGEGRLAKKVHSREKMFHFSSSELVYSPIRNIGRHISLKGPQAPAAEAKQKYAESCQARGPFLKSPRNFSGPQSHFYIICI